MKHNILKYFIVLLFFLISGQSVNAQVDASTLKVSKYVKDESGTLTQDQINSLLKKLVDFDKQTTNQVIVIMISSLNGESLEDYSMKIAEANKIGKKDRNNGVLFLIAKNDRKLRIEVGYGLEGALPDATTNSIIRNEVTPLFKQGKFYEGIDKGVDAIMLATKGEYKADKNSGKRDISSPVTCCFGAPLFIVLIFGFIFVSIIISFVRRIMGFGSNMYSGKGGSNWTNHGGWFGGGSGFTGGSSGSSFGSFSGGGGSFGGGGSSGSW